MKHLVLVGAGHAHVEVLRRFGKRPMAGVRLTLVTRELHTPYSGMLPGLVAGHYTHDEVHIAVAPLARFAEAELRQDAMTGLDLGAKRVICRDGPPVDFDLLSLDIGSTPDTETVPGASEHAIAVKPIGAFLARFEALRRRVLDRRGKAHIALVGAGAGGVELLLSVEQRLRREVQTLGADRGSLSFTLVSASREILPAFPPAFRSRFEKILARRGINLLAGAPVRRVEAGRLLIEGHAPLEADEILWATQAAGAPWLRGTGLALDRQGFLKVEASLRAEGCTDVFAAGDAAAFGPRDLPKAGVYAVRAGAVLAENLRGALSGQALHAFDPQRTALALVSTGERSAVGTRNGLVVEGGWVWRWKDLLDRRFVQRFNSLS